MVGWVTLFLEHVDTEVCEQVFSWMGGLGGLVHNMTANSYFLFFHFVIETHNELIERQLHADGLMR